MKQLLLTIALLIGFCLCLSAQTNPGFSYQAVARDANGKIMETQQLDLRFAIIKDDTGTGNGTIIYRERHQPSTNEFGLFTLIVGKGDSLFGDFNKIDWSQSNLWLQVDIDLNQDQRYTFMGKTRILPVPLALHAMSAENVDDDDADPTNELQLLEYDATTNTLRLTDGNSVQLANAGTGNDADADPTNEIQTITRNGLNVNLSDGGGTISVADNDNDPNNELQALSRVGDLITLSAGGGSFVDQTEDADADPTNEIQVVAFDPSTAVLSLSNGGGQIDLSSLKNGNGGSGTDDQQLTLNGNVLSIEDGNSIDLSAILPNDGDSDDQNELQTLSFDTTSYMLTLSDGNQVDLSSLKSFGNGGTTQNLSLNGSTLGITGGNTVDLSNLPDNVDDADANPQNELQVLSFDTTTLSLSLSDGNTVDLSSLKSLGNGGTTQNLSLNGTTLGITGGNNVDLSNLPDNVDDADADPMNEIQAISFDTATNILSLSNGGTVDLSSLASVTTAIPQTLTLNGSILEISNGNSIDLANLNKDDADADPMNELQSLSLTGDSLSLSDGNVVDLGSLNKDDADADPMNELQSLNLTGDSLSLSDGNAVDLSSLNKDDADADPMNELQSLSLNGDNLSLSDGNTIDLSSLNKDDADADPQNEIQMISFEPTTNVLTLSNGGMVDLSGLSDGVNDADADPQNEIQAISFDTATNILSLSNGGTVDLSSLASGTTATPQTLTLNGSVLEISDGNSIDLANLNKDDADADPQNEIQAINLSGNILSIDQANSVDLGLLNKDDADADPNNEIQNLNLNGNTLSINQGNSVDLSNLNKDDADADPQNEIQTISFDNNTNILNLSNGGTADLSKFATQGNGNQTLSLSGKDLSISNGNTISLDTLSSPWDIKPGFIEYLKGNTKVNELFIEAGDTLVSLTKDKLVFDENKNIGGFETTLDHTGLGIFEGLFESSILNHDSLSFFNSEISTGNIFTSEFSAKELQISDTLETAKLRNNGLLFDYSQQTGDFAYYGHDSLSFAYNVNFLTPFFADMDATKLHFWAPGGESKHYGGFSEYFFGPDTLSVDGLGIYVKGNKGNTPYERFRLEPNNFVMYNDVRFKSFEFITPDTANAATFNMYPGNGFGPYIQMGPGEIDPLEPELKLRYNDKTSALLTSEFGYGRLNLFNPSGIPNLCLSAFSGIQYSDTTGLAGLDIHYDEFSSRMKAYLDKFDLGFYREGLSQAVLALSDSGIVYRDQGEDVVFRLGAAPLSGGIFSPYQMDLFSSDFTLYERQTLLGGPLTTVEVPTISLNNNGTAYFYSDSDGLLSIDNHLIQSTGHDDFLFRGIRRYEIRNSTEKAEIELFNPVSGQSNVLISSYGQPGEDINSQFGGGSILLSHNYGEKAIESVIGFLNIPTVNVHQGFFQVLDETDNTHAIMGSSFAGGFMELYGQNLNKTISIGNIIDPNRGIMDFHNELGNIDLRLGAGVNGGFLSLFKSNGSRLHLLEIIDNAAAYYSYGANDNLNVYIGPNASNANYGQISIQDETGASRAGMIINSSGQGTFFSDLKHFRMDHPEDENKEIWYVSLEGPEAAAYERGTAELEDGEAFIPFSDHYQLVANPETMTVLVTPLSAESTGLAVVKKTAEGFYVKELFKGTGSYEFDWEVKSVRKGYEDYEVIRNKKKD